VTANASICALAYLSDARRSSDELVVKATSATGETRIRSCSPIAAFSASWRSVASFSADGAGRGRRTLRRATASGVAE
jgi:hypothetical protein